MSDDFRQKMAAAKERAVKIRKNVAASKPKSKQTNQRMDFSKLDQLGNPVISFDPNSPERAELLEIIGRHKKDKTRKRVLDKIGAEFGRIYVRYRRQAESASKVRAGVFAYEVPDTERQYAVDAGIQCLIKGVTPRRLLEYWHKNIKTFANRGLIIPPLSMLKSPGMVDQVACSAPVEIKSAFEEDDEPKRKDEIRTSFGDTSRLDERLRRGLDRAGFDTQDYSDRYLLTVQQLAKSVGGGTEVFIPSKLRPMVSWAVDNLYRAVE